MAKKCEKCGAVMPEEANICLSCFTVYGEGGEALDGGKLGLAATLKLKLSSINKKKATAIIAAAVCILLILPIGIHTLNNSNPPALSESYGTTKNNNAVVSTTTNDDGSVITAYEDGTIETESTDGTVIMEKADGTVVTKTTDGTVKTQKNDGTVITEKSDGTVITEKTDGTVITENPDGTTEVTQVPTTTTTTATQPTEATTEATTTTTTTTTEATTSVSSVADFTYISYSNGTATLTAYSGTAAHVIVPDIIDGYPVVSLKQSIFSNNSNIKQITFSDTVDNSSQINIQNGIIRNCTNLEKIIFEGDEHSIQGAFATNCQKLCEIQTPDRSDYKFVDGVFYRGNLIVYYCEGASQSTFNVPDWCTGALTSGCFDYCTNLRVINCSSATLAKYCENYKNNYLEAVNIPDGVADAFDVNGIPFVNNTCSFYPPNSKLTAFTIPASTRFIPNSVNKNLVTLTIPSDVTLLTSASSEYYLKNICNKKTFPNLATIYVESGNAHIDYIKENFNGTVEVY